MQKFKSFSFHNPSMDLSQIEDFRFKGGSREATPDYGKPVRIFQTQGLQIVGVPPELTRILPVHVINRADGVKTSVSCHFETEQGFYLLRVRLVCHMAMPA
jgi:hypothetical protein